MNMNLKGIMQTMGVKMGEVVSNPYARAFAPQVEVIKEEDHEVSMGQNQLDTIIKMATELKAKMGETEKEIPAWIQDHISKAENYISQAAGNYHEYGTNEGVNEAVDFKDGKYRFYSKDGVGYLTYNGKILSHGDFDWEDGSNSYWMSHSSWGGQKAFDTGKDVIAYFKSKKITTESVNEEFKHTIYVDTPTQVVSKPIAAEIEALAKKGVRSKDIGLKMGFVGNQKAATDAFQKVKNQIYFKLDKANESVNEVRLTGIVRSIVETPVIGKMVGSKLSEAKKYDVGAGYMGNGLTIWNRAEEEHGDYRIIAHIDPHGKISIRDKEIPSDVMKMIKDWAEAMKKGNK